MRELIRKVWGVVRDQPFIAFSGLAALAHSTWSISTAFHGFEPALFSPEWFLWVAFGFAFAFAVDVGQISISADLRNGERTRFKYGSFLFLAILSYYFQWMYLVTHVPLLNLGAGVATYYVAPVRFLLDLGVWIVPALLPVSSVLYAFSYGKVRRTVSVERTNRVKIEMPEGTVLQEMHQVAQLEAGRGAAMKLLAETPELQALSLGQLQKRYPQISKSTWQRAKKEFVDVERGHSNEQND